MDQGETRAQAFMLYQVWLCPPCCKGQGRAEPNGGELPRFAQLRAYKLTTITKATRNVGTSLPLLGSLYYVLSADRQRKASHSVACYFTDGCEPLTVTYRHLMPTELEKAG